MINQPRLRTDRREKIKFVGICAVVREVRRSVGERRFRYCGYSPLPEPSAVGGRIPSGHGG